MNHREAWLVLLQGFHTLLVTRMLIFLACRPGRLGAVDAPIRARMGGGRQGSLLSLLT